jgi:hypothetical protein
VLNVKAGFGEGHLGEAALRHEVIRIAVGGMDAGILIAAGQPLLVAFGHAIEVVMV